MADLETLLADTRYWLDQGSDPAAPAAGEPVTYTKSGQLYVRNSAGIVGPLLDETAHDALDHTGLTGVGGGGGGASLANVMVGPIPWFTASVVNVSPVANRAVYLRFSPTTSITVATARFAVQTTGGNVDVGIYNADLSSRLGSTGSTALPSQGPASIALTGSVALTAGTIYYAGFTLSSASARVLTATVTALGAVTVDFSGYRFLGRQESALPLPASPTIAGWEDTGFVPLVYFTA